MIWHLWLVHFDLLDMMYLSSLSISGCCCFTLYFFFFLLNQRNRCAYQLKTMCIWCISRLWWYRAKFIGISRFFCHRCFIDFPVKIAIVIFCIKWEVFIYICKHQSVFVYSRNGRRFKRKFFLSFCAIENWEWQLILYICM